MIIAGWERAVCTDRQVRKSLHGYWYRPAGSQSKWWIPERDMDAHELAKIRSTLAAFLEPHSTNGGPDHG